MPRLKKAHQDELHEKKANVKAFVKATVPLQKKFKLQNFKVNMAFVHQSTFADKGCTMTQCFNPKTGKMENSCLRPGEACPSGDKA